MGIAFILLAAILASISNFCMRRSIDAGGSSKPYLIVQITLSLLVMILLNPVRTGEYTWNPVAINVGLLGGLFFGFLMWMLGKTLEKGPPGLSFAVLNSSSIVPAIVMSVLFGASFGHPYTIWHAVGSTLVVIGLFWAGWSSEENPQKALWTTCAAFVFFSHALFLAFLQWWAMLLKPDLPFSPLLPFHLIPSQTQWFMPAIFFVAALFQIIIYVVKQRQLPKGSEIYYGILGGITNGACTFFLILATQHAHGWQNAILFPLFSVSIILICNAWAQLLYKEAVNWKANGVCVAGILIATIAWA